MKMKDRINNIIKNIIHTIVVCVIIVSMFIFFNLEPYEWWDTTVIDYDMLLFARLVGVILCVVNIILACITKRKRIMRVIYMTLAIISFCKLASLFFV